MVEEKCQPKKLSKTINLFIAKGKSEVLSLYPNDYYDVHLDMGKNTFAFILITSIIISIIVLWNVSTRSNPNLFNDVYAIGSKAPELEKQLKFKLDNSIIQYALEKINNDRIKFNLPLVKLTQNEAAQLHAEDVFKTKSNSTHWTTDGMKPYMKYSAYGGTGYIEQNIASRGYNNDTLNKCKNGIAKCDMINPYEEIEYAQQTMVYNDTMCCADSHRNNILDKKHTHVSIGIAYDDYYFVMVQNFENNYIQFNEPLTQDNKHIHISGKMQSKNNTLHVIGIYYDETPTHLVYDQNKDNKSYKLGKFIASVVKPAPLLSQYKQPSNYTLIEADKWSQNDEYIDVHFDLSPILEKGGIYTIVSYFRDTYTNEKFPVTSYSIFEE